MKVDVLIGLQWGDEGKGKIIDTLAKNYNIVSRFQGGPNAGHTLKLPNGNNLILHLIPSGILNENVMNVVGTGVAFDPLGFMEEYAHCNSANPMARYSIIISERATVIHPYYILLDRLAELKRGKENAVGSTLKGIGPTYAEKCNRKALQVGDLVTDGGVFNEKYLAIKAEVADFVQFYSDKYSIEVFEEPSNEENDRRFTEKNFNIREKQWLDSVKRLNNLHDSVSMRLVQNTELYLDEALRQGKKVLAEGAQGVMLDKDFGDYPMVTSSNTITAGVFTGLGISPKYLGKVIGVIKSYTTKVGGGVFPCQMPKDIEEFFRKAGDEYGATTGRPRNCGWLDLVQLKHAIRICGVDELVMLKTDVCPVEKVKVIKSYYGKAGRVYRHDLPLHLSDLQDVKESEKFKGWKIAKGVNSFEDIPEELQSYISFIQEELGVPIVMIGTGPGREDVVHLNVVEKVVS
jgi:adenylosuccinate synthase